MTRPPFIINTTSCTHLQVLRLKHSLKETQALAAAAQAEAAAAGNQSALQGQLHEAVRERERCV